MTSPGPRSSLAERTAAVAAVLFGLATIVAGSRVLAGLSDPGYVVFRPLLIYNTVMGMAYVAAGVGIWRVRGWSLYAAAGIALLNLLVLGGVLFLYSSGGAVAIESVRAMQFRTVVWLLIAAGVWWGRRRRAARVATGPLPDRVRR